MPNPQLVPAGEPAGPPAAPFLSPADFKRRATAADRFQAVPFEVPDFGGSVYLRRLTAGDLDEYQAAVAKCPDDRTRATILAHAVADATNRRAFLDADVPDLAKVDAAVLVPVIRRFQELNGLLPKG